MDRIAKSIDERARLVRKQPRDTAGVHVVKNATAGYLEERVVAIGERASALEHRQARRS